MRDLPRLSVDIDLTYLPTSDRNTALTDIRLQFTALAENLERTVSDSKVHFVKGSTPKLFVEKSRARIKLEPSTVIRGSLVPPVSSELCPTAQDTYDFFVEIQRLDAPDLYAGKLCAALDRQHPRDVFDIMHLQAAGPIPESIRQAFVVYLASHRRPMSELIRPNFKPIGDLFDNHFVGMTRDPVELADIEAARTRLFDWVLNALTENERRFLFSIKQGEPDWTLLPFEGLEQWPAIQWKLHNIRRMSPRSHSKALNRLRAALDI